MAKHSPPGKLNIIKPNENKEYLTTKTKKLFKTVEASPIFF